MNLSNSFLTVLKVFVDFFPCVSGLEISFYILVLSFIRNSNFNTYFRPKIIKLSNSLLNVLKMFGNFFSFLFGLETSWYLLILLFLKNSNYNTYFRPEIVKLHNPLLTVLNISVDFFFMRLRAGNKLVYPHFTTFTKFKFHPLFFGLRLWIFLILF